MIGKDRMMEVLGRALSDSRCDQTEVSVVGQDSYLTRYSQGYVHQNVGEHGFRVTVRAAAGKRIGVASTDRMDDESVRAAVREAIEVSRLSPIKEDFTGFPGPEPAPAVADQVSRATHECPPDLRAAYVQRVIDMAKDRNVSVAGSLTTETMELAVVNSLGTRAYFAQTRAMLTCVATGPDSSGYAEEMSTDLSRLDPTRVAQTAIAKCLMSKDPSPVPPGEYDVILEPPAVSDMMIYLALLGFSADKVQDGSSFMSGRIGERITGEDITIWDDGLDPEGLVMPFDFEGVPKQKVVLIENGVAKGAVYDSLSAGKEGRKSTGHSVGPWEQVRCFPTNMFMAGGKSSIQEMIASTDRGILVTRFHYVNPIHPAKTIITGMTRDGTFLIEGGKIVRGLRNLRFTESILGALSRVEAISKDRTLMGGLVSIIAPAVKIRGFTFTGATEF